MKLKDKISIVTGGARGIGIRICEELLKEGATVYIFDVNDKEGKEAAGRLKSAYGNGSTVYSQELFEEQVKHDVDIWLGDAMPGDEVKATLWEEINEKVLSEGEFECEAFHAANDFESETDFEFCDFWENSFKTFTFHFIWRLYAIVWAIQQYDALKDNAGQDARVPGFKS